MKRDSFANQWVKLEPGQINQSPEDIEPGHSTYKLEGREVVPCKLEELIDMFGPNSKNRIVARDEFEGGKVAVSTVFLAMNHQWGGGPPIVFETMIFGGEHADETWRCSTYAQAEEQHKKALALVES